MYIVLLASGLDKGISQKFNTNTMATTNLDNLQGNNSSNDNHDVPFYIIFDALSDNLSLSIFKSIYFSSRTRRGIGVNELTMLKIDLKTKKLVNRKISRLIKAGLVAIKKYEDEDCKDCRYYYVTSLGRNVHSFQKLVEDALDIEPSLKGNDKIRTS